ncbi:conserved hypothetical protein [Nitrosopumilaceae archaeon]|nr:hypothetical protein [Nitrosopumilus sp.]CAI9832838.1 conserved hypothetical protein [Nitrosopumilaceae archaeon]MDA7943631.1 hypothetical protein [Nitrosopumilus sp.]MDA7944346.1 hypothetical protein [Nitrosopumilus sp.]MDA7954098.1 hypothetical protein [Nitrosopumilus sp.]
MADAAGLLAGLVSAHDELADLEAGGIDEVRGLLLRINGLARAARRACGASQDLQLRGMAPLLDGYLGGYDFEAELGVMSTLYAGDAGRIRSMRLKILEALGEGGMVEEARGITG